LPIKHLTFTWLVKISLASNRSENSDVEHNGAPKNVVKRLEEQMAKQAKNEFVRAARLRDQLQMLKEDARRLPTAAN